MTANEGADMNHASVMLSSTPRVLDVPPDLADARGVRTRRRRIAEVLGALRGEWAH
jgi:hypothetical protein